MKKLARWARAWDKHQTVRPCCTLHKMTQNRIDPSFYTTRTMAPVWFFYHTYFQHHSQFQLSFMFRQSVGMSVYRHATQEAPTQCWWQASACLSPPWQQWQQPQRPLHRPHPHQSSLIRGWCDSEGRVGLLQIARLVSGLTCPWSIDCSVNVCVNTRHTA